MDKGWKLALGFGCVSIVSVGAGYLICKLIYCRSERKAAKPVVQRPLKKSYEDDDPLQLYVVEHTNAHPVMKKLHTLSCSQSKGGYTTALEQDSFLTLLAKSINANKAIDVGMYYGCSALAMALGVTDEGKVIGLEITAEYIENGKPFFAEAGVSDKIDVRIKDAKEGLAEIIANGESGTYDMVFLDAFKEDYPNYIEPVCTLLRSGGLFVVDNVLFQGTVIEPQCNRSETLAIRKFNIALKNDPRFEVVMLKVVDGITIARKV